MMFDNSASDPSSFKVRQLFDRIAPVYDGLNDLLSLGQHHIWKKMAVRWCNPQPGQRFLDLCCGSGDVAIMLARKVAPTGHVVGVDFAVAQLAIAAQKSQRTPDLDKLITWQAGDAIALEFPANSFDGATLAYGLRNVVDIPQCLSELCRVLKPQAYAAILDFHRPQDPIMAQFQQWYLAQVVVPMAQKSQMYAEYAYLAPSLARFPIGTAQVRLAIAAGFSSAKHYPIASGMMGVLVLQK